MEEKFELFEIKFTTDVIGDEMQFVVNAKFGDDLAYTINKYGDPHDTLMAKNQIEALVNKMKNVVVDAFVEGKNETKYITKIAAQYNVFKIVSEIKKELRE